MTHYFSFIHLGAISEPGRVIDACSVRFLTLLAAHTLVFAAVGCTQATSKPESTPSQGSISTYEECAAAGNPIAKSYPPQCHMPDGRVFIKKVGELKLLPPKTETGCKNLCGNGTCEEIVCMALGCPCAESSQTCPSDCKDK